MLRRAASLFRIALFVSCVSAFAVPALHAQAVNANGGFESSAVGATPTGGITGWVFSGWNEGLAGFEVVGSPVYEGGRALQVTVDALGGDPWNIEATNEGIPVEPGGVYRYTIRARSDLDGATANFTVGDATYQELGRIDNAQVSLTSAWQTFSFEFTVGSQQTVRAPIHLSFSANQERRGGGPKATIIPGVIHLDDLRIEPVQTVPPPTTTPLAAGQAKFLGNVYSSSQITHFEYYWTQITPENAGKWGSVEATRDVMNWDALDAAYAFAGTHGLPFRFHVLVWGSQYPAWVEGLSPAEQRAEIEEWYAAVAARYPNLDYVEVVNEPVNQPIPFKDALGGDGATGWDWVIEAFVLARQYFPNSALMINEYGMLSAGPQPLGQYETIIQLLVDRGLIDGVGLQGHAFSTSWAGEYTLSSNLDAIAAFGLPIQITEMDVDGPTDAEQLAEYQRLFPLFWEHPAVEGITLWGWKPGMWRTAEGAYIVNSDGTERPAVPWLREYLGGGTGSGPAAPSGLAATAASDTEIDLTWTDASADEDGFTVERSLDGSAFSEIATLAPDATAYSDGGLAAATTYHYRVRAFNAAGTSAYSNTATATTTGGGGSGATMHVASITTGATGVGQGQKAGTATVVIVDENGNPVSSASVMGTFSGSINEAASGTTGADGSVSFQTAGTSKGSVTLTFCVDGVSHGARTYDPASNVETCSALGGKRGPDPATAPEAFELLAAHPSPFLSTATIGYVLPVAARVRLTVYDALGREVERLVDGTVPAGLHRAVFDAGERPSGLYLYRLEARAGDGRVFERTGRVVRVR